MKHRYSPAAWTLVLVALLALPRLGAAQATDTLVVEWADDQGFPVINALRDAILGDTTAAGERANPDGRVYKLRRGGFYFHTERITNGDHPLRIVGETSPASANPAVLMKLNREDGSIDDKLILAQGDVTLEHVVINGESDQGNLPYEPVRFDGAGARIEIDDVVFEHAQWGIMAVYGKNSDVSITNSHFRNLVSETQKWGGRGISLWTDIDSLHVENTTFFNVGAVPIQAAAGVEFFWFNHNTLVNVGRALAWGSLWKEAYVTNNLIVNGYWHGEDEGDFTAERLEQPRAFYSGMLGVSPLPSEYGLDIEREIAVVANATFRDAAFDAYYAGTSGDINPELPNNAFGTLRGQPFLNDSTRYFFDAWDNLVLDRHIDGVDPGLAAYGEANFNDMIAFIAALRAGEAELPLWYWDPNRADENISVAWPMPEDLSYTNAQLRAAGIGGFPLGDLNWFPAEKQAWQAREAALAMQIKDLVSAGGSAQLVATTEAEAGTLSGDAAVEQPPSLLYASLQGGGYIEWTFDVAAGTYDVAVESRAEFGEKYQHLVVNGTQLNGTQHGSSRGEAIHVAANGADTWFEAVVEDVDFTAGTNTLRIKPSWGYSNHRDVILRDQNGETVARLSITAAVRENVALNCDGDLCASGNAYVAVSGGGVAWNYDREAGQYLLRLHYLADAQAQANLYVNGALAGTGITFTAASDDWATVDVTGLSLSAGVNTVELRDASAAVRIDRVDLFQIVGSGVDREDDVLPAGYALDQNFPNPFNPRTTIAFTLAQPGAVSLAVYDVLGRQVARLVDGALTSGRHEAVWDGRDAAGLPVASGVYLYRIETPVGVQTRSMVLLK